MVSSYFKDYQPMLIYLGTFWSSKNLQCVKKVGHADKFEPCKKILLLDIMHGYVLMYMIDEIAW